MASANPITEFLNAVERAKSHQVDTAPVTLATADERGRPSSRMVLLRGADERGFVFHTNYRSRKGRDLARNARASLLFYWGGLERQVRVDGVAAKVSARESDEYFATRPRGSQLSAWASVQSETLAGRAAIERRFAAFERKYPGAVPRPPHWGGYRLLPDAIEFWQGREDRLHDRIVYRRGPRGRWIIERLAP